MRGAIWLSMIMGLMSSLLAVPSAASGQDPTAGGSERGPRFLLAALHTSGPPRPVDAASVPVLRRRVSLDLADVDRRRALAAISRASGLRLVYANGVVPRRGRVRLKAEEITVAAALTDVLLDAGVDVLLAPGGNLVLVKRTTPPAPGAVQGRVIDAGSGQPLAGAMITVEGTRLSAVANSDGGYRIGGLEAGTYSLRVRFIGYTPASMVVTVRAGEDVTADFVMAKSPHELDQLVVTGTIVPTAVKALPTPVSVVTEREIAHQRPRNIQDIFRKSVPGAVSWVNSEVPYDTKFSVRGASSLVPSATSMKILIDGIETANAGFSQIDPASIARVEVIRGPQAAAIYGSEAIGGVIQIFTKRGDQGLARPQVNAEVATGLVQTPYSGFRGVLRQEYKASVRGGALGMGYHLGVGYMHLDDWLPPVGEISRQSAPSVHGGMNFSRGAVSVDVSGRYYDQKGGNKLVNPALQESGFIPFSKASFQKHHSQNLTVGARVSVAARDWWQTAIKVGIDRRAMDIEQTRRRLTTPGDTLFQISNRVDTKPSVGLTTTMEGTVSPGMSGSLTAGLDHWTYTHSDFSTLGALTSTGAIQLAPGQTFVANRNVIKNTGYFAQTQVGFRDAVFLTVGLRAEENSSFGDQLGTPLLPRVGLTYVHPIGRATVKLRGSWGRAIKAPSSGAKTGFTSPFGDQLPNPDLGPERQQGWDVGFDATFGSNGSLGVTYYNQTADDLIDIVVQLTPVRTQQFQNVGRVKNTGLELEGTLLVGAFTLRGQYGYARARVEQLSPTYAGDLLVGDQPRMRPKHTAGVAFTATPRTGTTVSTGLTYMASWTNTDIVAQFRCFGQTAPCRPTGRDYLVKYPALLKVNASVVQQLTAAIAGFMAFDNLTNNQRHEVDNLGPVMGRTTTIGLRLEY